MKYLVSYYKRKMFSPFLFPSLLLSLKINKEKLWGKKCGIFINKFHIESHNNVSYLFKKNFIEYLI